MPPRMIAAPAPSGCSSTTFPAPALTSTAPRPSSGALSLRLARGRLSHNIPRTCRVDRSIGRPALGGRDQVRQNLDVGRTEVGRRQARQDDEPAAWVAAQALELFLGDAAVGPQAARDSQR